MEIDISQGPHLEEVFFMVKCSNFCYPEHPIAEWPTPLHCDSSFAFFFLVVSMTLRGSPVCPILPKLSKPLGHTTGFVWDVWDLSSEMSGSQRI